MFLWVFVLFQSCAAASETFIKCCSIYSRVSHFKNTSTVLWSPAHNHSSSDESELNHPKSISAGTAEKYHELCAGCCIFHDSYINLVWAHWCCHSSSDLDERMKRNFQCWLSHRGQRLKLHKSSQTFSCGVLMTWRASFNTLLQNLPTKEPLQY